MTTYLETRWGSGGEDPTEADMTAALAELTTPDPEHPDCWLSDEDGRVVAAHEDGRIVFEDTEGEAGPRHLVASDSELALTLWKHLQAGELDKISEYPWKPGYQE